MIYGDLSSPEIGRLAPRSVALLPIAAIEQHGAHLPVITDTALTTEIAQRAEQALPRKVILLPTLWAGCSHHHKDFPGALSISSETYITLLEELVECLLESGFRRIVLLNGHGGNTGPAAEALYRLTLKHEKKTSPLLAVATYWQVAANELSRQDFMETPRLTHACEYETSLMMALRTDWVQLGKAKGERVMRQSKYYDPLGYTPSRIFTCETFGRMTSTGAMGKPELATRKKGLRLFDLVSAPMIDFLKEFSAWKTPRVRA